MALEQRLDRVNQPPDQYLPVIPFISLLTAYATGNLTAIQVKNNLEEVLSSSLSANEISDLQFIQSNIDALSNEGQKLLYIFKVWHILNLAEFQSMSAFNNLSDVKIALSLN